MEKKLKEDIVKAADSIRKKYRILKRGLVEEETEVKKTLRTLTKAIGNDNRFDQGERWR